MIPWNEAYRRLKQSPDFSLLFGRSYRQDEFAPYHYGLKFDSLSPALLATSSDPNDGDQLVTENNIAAPATNIVPGPPDGPRLLTFPAGAVILGITASAQVLQREVNLPAPTPNVVFTYPPSEHPGGRDLFMLELAYADNDPITAGNPVSELVSFPQSPVITRPPIMADPLVGGGRKDITPGYELYVTPGLGINVTCRSLLLPTTISTVDGSLPPNLVVHVVFHCMVPGTVKIKRATDN